MIFKRKTPEDLRREDFERQCREATQKVIARAKEKPKADLYGAPWPYEKISLLKEDRTTTRIRGSAFLWASLISFMAGVALVANEIFIGGALALTVSPCLLIYSVIRALFGGKDGIGAAITTVVVEEFLKKGIVDSIEKRGKKRRH